MGYGEAPWEFKGRALYQLSLVRVEEARKYVPPELPLVNLFGWTLGGFYLARYSASPVGAFDECVALAGLAWNFPTSCAWAARVYVNDRVARDHGISSVGLPSRLASFKALPLPELSASKQRQQRGNSWWDVPQYRTARGGGAAGTSAPGAGMPTAAVELCNSEPSSTASGFGRLLGRLVPGSRQERGVQQNGARGLAIPVCRIEVPQLAPSWAPKIQMCLPSFSGATPDCPGLLKYSLKLTAHIRPLPPAKVTFPLERPAGERSSAEVLDAVLGGRPLLCLAFDNMHMEVQPPEPWHPKGTGLASSSNARMQPAAV